VEQFGSVQEPRSRCRHKTAATNIAVVVVIVRVGKFTTALLRLLEDGYRRNRWRAKKAARLRSNDSLVVDVSRIRLVRDPFEVVLSLDEWQTTTSEMLRCCR
jgi:hypothetical protein